jgi:hypothetical protein
MKPEGLPAKSDEVPEAVHEKYMDWIIEQQLEISKLLTVVNEQQHKIKLLESQIGNVESELPQLNAPHRGLRLLSHLTQKRSALVALAVIFVWILGSVAYLLIEREGEGRRVNLVPTPTQRRAPVATVIPPSPAIGLGQSGEKARSPDEAIVTPPVIAQIPNRSEEVKVVDQPRVTDQPRVNRPIKRKIFVVNQASFLRSKPDANADVIATLNPGSRIEITKAGEYFRVRALDGDNLSGFVHKEDAFFEPMP